MLGCRFIYRPEEWESSWTSVGRTFIVDRHVGIVVLRPVHLGGEPWVGREYVNVMRVHIKVYTSKKNPGLAENM